MSDVIDGGHEIIKCSGCDCPLVDIWHIRPYETKITRIFATCPWCGEQSYIQEIKGGFCIGDTEYCIKEDIVYKEEEGREIKKDENLVTMVVMTFGVKEWKM